MAHKVIVPPKKNYIPQFLKQRDINSYYGKRVVIERRSLKISGWNKVRQSFSGANPQKSACQSKQANPVWFHLFVWQRLWSPKIDFEESIPPGWESIPGLLNTGSGQAKLVHGGPRRPMQCRLCFNTTEISWEIWGCQGTHRLALFCRWYYEKTSLHWFPSSPTDGSYGDRWFGYIARLSRWEKEGNFTILLVQIISTCLLGAWRGGGCKHPVTEIEFLSRPVLEFLNNLWG
jgi:hypothetical protein